MNSLLNDIDIYKGQYPCKHTLGFYGELTGGKTTSAKTAALLLQAFYNVKVCSFALDVKSIARDFGWDGSKDAKGRRLLQVIGTEAGREYDPDVWIKYAFIYLNNIFDLDTKERNIAIFDDLRFVNEVKWIKHNGGIIIKVVDGKVKDEKEIAHASEKGISDVFTDYTIHNDLNIFHLVRDMYILLTRLGFTTLKAGRQNG